MVTDQQYKELLERIDSLEKKLNDLSRKYTEQQMKSHQPKSVIESENHIRKTKDKTKYLFNGQEFGKRQLVLAVIKSYVATHGIKASAELKQIFPDRLQGSLGVIREVTSAEQYDKATNRYFFGDDEVLKLEDGDFAVCKEWEKKNIDRFIKAAVKAGEIIETIIVNE